MSSNSNNPKDYDIVLGNPNMAPRPSAVLGGIKGVKQGLSSQKIESRIAALHSALNYGKEGLELLLLALNDTNEKIHLTAYQVLKCRKEPDVKVAVTKYFQYHYMIFFNGLYYTPLTPSHLQLMKFYPDGTISTFVVTCNERLCSEILLQLFNKNKKTAGKLIYDIDGKDIKLFTTDKLIYCAQIETPPIWFGHIIVCWKSFAEQKIRDYAFFHVPGLE